MIIKIDYLSVFQTQTLFQLAIIHVSLPGRRTWWSSGNETTLSSFLLFTKAQSYSPTWLHLHSFSWLPYNAFIHSFHCIWSVVVIVLISSGAFSHRLQKCHTCAVDVNADVKTKSLLFISFNKNAEYRQIWIRANLTAIRHIRVRTEHMQILMCVTKKIVTA